VSSPDVASSFGRPLTLVKAHAYGNDFLLLDERGIAPSTDRRVLARAACDRHRGIGADGLIIFGNEASRVSMRLLNADGSPSEISGNGVRCLGSWIAHSEALEIGGALTIDTDAGSRRLDLLDRRDRRFRFRTHMGHPEQIRMVRLAVDEAEVEAVTMRVGNPQCVVLGSVTEARLHTIAAGLAAHPHFAEGTNVELADVEHPDRVRILIWERGVGPTEASGTGACAAAVAAIAYCGLPRDVQVVAPGGTQRVEWLDDGLYLTGWAELIGQIQWWGMPDA
jgi:diaminopimelate epimerase